MDGLAGLLNGPRASAAFLLRMVMDPPWSVRIEDEAPLTLCVPVRGTAWITADASGAGASTSEATIGGAAATGDPVRLEPGDVAVVLGPGPYVVSGDPSTPPQAIIGTDQACRPPDGGSDLPLPGPLGPRTWGTSADGATLMLVGTYAQPGEISRRVLRALPPLLVQRADGWDGALVPLLHDEIGRDLPGQEAVLDRLLDLVLVAVLRAWFSRPDSGAPGWYRAQADPVVGLALRLMHDAPAHRWTVASLASEIGISRAARARRFHALVGEPPMAFLTEWRLALAADLLHEPGATVGSVADAVGYGSPFALSTAFKRVRGVSPAEHRRRGTAPAV